MYALYVHIHAFNTLLLHYLFIISYKISHKYTLLVRDFLNSFFLFNFFFNNINVCEYIFFISLYGSNGFYIFIYISGNVVCCCVQYKHTHRHSLSYVCKCMKFQRVTIKNASLLLFFFFSSFFDGFFTICTNFLIDTIT